MIRIPAFLALQTKHQTGPRTTVVRHSTRPLLYGWESQMLIPSAFAQHTTRTAFLHFHSSTPLKKIKKGKVPIDTTYYACIAMPKTGRLNKKSDGLQAEITFSREK